MFLGGVVFYCFIIGVTILLGGDLRSFNDLSSLVFVLLSNVAILIITKGFKDFLYGVKLLVLKNIEINRAGLIESMKIFNMLHKTSFGISFLGFVIGIINMLQGLDEPSSIGPYFAVAILIPFYSVMLDLVIIIPARFILSKIERKYN